MQATRASKPDGYVLGSYRIATAPEPNSSRLTSFKSTCFDSPANNVGPWPASLGRTPSVRLGEMIVDKIETVALMAASIYGAGPAGQATTTAEVTYGRVAAQAWALYDAVEKQAAERHSHR